MGEDVSLFLSEKLRFSVNENRALRKVFNLRERSLNIGEKIDCNEENQYSYCTHHQTIL